MTYRKTIKQNGQTFTDESLIDPTKPYDAEVVIKGKAKTSNNGFSTMFPDNMTPQEVVDAINEAFDNRTAFNGSNRVFEGNSNGLKIRMYINNQGKIENAHPVLLITS